MSKQCAFLKTDGVRCNAYALHASQFCLSHDPAAKETKRHAVQKGGSADSYHALDLGLPPFTIASAADVSKAVIETINELRAGDLPPRLANTIGYLLTVALKAYEVSDISKKLEALDAVLLQRREK